MMNILHFFRKNWIRFLVSFLIGVTLVLAYIIIRASSVGAEVWGEIEYYRDGFTLAGFVLLFVGGLSALTNFGAFDIFSYYPNRKRKEDNTKEQYYEYVERKKESRRKYRLFFLPYIIIATIYLIVAVILLLIIASKK